MAPIRSKKNKAKLVRALRGGCRDKFTISIRPDDHLKNRIYKNIRVVGVHVTKESVQRIKKHTNGTITHVQKWDHFYYIDFVRCDSLYHLYQFLEALAYVKVNYGAGHVGISYRMIKRAFKIHIARLHRLYKCSVGDVKMPKRRRRV